MKSLVLTTTITLYTFGCFAQRQWLRPKIRPCNSYPTAERQMQLLRYKPIGVYLYNFSLNCNVNDSVKNRLLYLLTPGFTNKEVEEFSEKHVVESSDYNDILNKASVISNGNDSLYNVSKDSMISVWKRYYVKELYEQKEVLGVNESLVRVVAFLHFKEAIPILKKNFEVYNRVAVEDALARLGDKAMQKKVIAECNTSLLESSAKNDWDWLLTMNKNVRRLAFIATQESVYQINNWIDTSKYFWYSSSGDDGKSANQVIAVLGLIIGNNEFHEMIKNVDATGGSWDNKVLIDIKNWLKRNKGKYELTPDFNVF